MSELALRLIEENKHNKNIFLDLSLCDITELPEELFECTWLKGLNLNENQITDFFFLDKLTGLQRLDLDWNQITDFSFLNKLTDLQRLNLSGNQITDFSFLDELTSLQSLNLSHNQITDISFLEKLTNLQSLNLRFNQITDFSFLEKLTGLQSLDLSRNLIADFSFLEKLTGLQSLNLSFNQITDFSFLEKLTSLQSLNLSGNQIIDIPFLEKLTDLQSLDLGWNQITDISFLEKLTSLQSLNLRFNQITNFFFLEKLTGLQSLNLSGNQITNISFLEKLTGLQSLDLNENKILDFSFLEKLTSLQSLDLSNNQITDISFLEKLTSLQSLNLSSNQILDFFFLEKLTGLQSLNLSSNQITNISFLEKLTGLQRLNLSGNQITDIFFLEKLTGLQRLYLSSNQIKLLDDTLLSRLFNLRSLDLSENKIKNVRPEIYNQGNCLKDLKNYFKNSRKESIQIYESKVILVGNGRVGKTCLVKRWLDDTFDPDEPSTHAIQLRAWELPQLAEDNNLKAVKLNIWDFGGQDIYHATHRFFMRTQALFLLIWDAQTEQKPEQEDEEDKKIKYKNHPLPYWLSYIKTQSGNSPVIVVQSKAETDGETEPSLSEKTLKEFNVCKIVSVDSAKNSANGFPELEGGIEKVVYKQIKESCTRLPAQWHRVRMKIQELQEEGIKQISLAQFEGLCSEEELDKSSANTLLHYLHNSGIFFYQQDIFNNQIVIDQKWAIDAVYALFNRKSNFFKNLHGRGQFTGADVQEIWKDYKSEEQQLFISFMQQCEICFEVKEEEARNKEIPFEERRFIAPQLLPDERPVKEIAYAFEEGEGIYFKYRHRFLHAAVIQRFIVRTGFLARHNTMWKEGILIKTEEGAALAEAFTSNNELLVRIKGVRRESLLAKIRNELKEINQDEQGIEESVSLDGQTFVSLKSLKEKPVQNEKIQAENDTWVKASDYRLFLNPDERIKFDKIKDKPVIKPQEELPKIYFSYAWRDKENEDREKFVSELYNSLKKEADKYSIVRDKEDLGYKGSISEFMKEIGRGDMVVVAISDKYLKSEYCMYELHELYLNSNSDLNELLKKIFPVQVENLELNDPEILSTYFDYWVNLEQKWKDLVKNWGDRIAPEQQEKYRKIKKIATDLGSFLFLLADINSRTVELLSDHDFAEIKTAIEQRMKEMNG